MIESVVCPTCRRALKVPDTLLGQLVKCPSCEQTFTASEDLEKAPRPGMNRSRDDPEEEELETVDAREPKRNGRSDRRREEDRDRDRDRDRRSRRRDWEEDDDDDRRGRRRRKPKEIPGKAQAVAIMTLVGGILAVLMAGVWALTCVGLLWPGTYYSLVCGIMCIVKGAQMLSPAGHHESPPTPTAIMQIVNIIALDVFNVALGILNLVFINDDEVRGYYRG